MKIVERYDAVRRNVILFDGERQLRNHTPTGSSQRRHNQSPDAISNWIARQN